jgi:hypothetical protein
VTNLGMTILIFGPGFLVLMFLSPLHWLGSLGLALMKSNSKYKWYYSDILLVIYAIGIASTPLFNGADFLSMNTVFVTIVSIIALMLQTLFFTFFITLRRNAVRKSSFSTPSETNAPNN